MQAGHLLHEIEAQAGALAPAVGARQGVEAFAQAFQGVVGNRFALVEQQRFSLLEKLTAEVLALAAEHPSVRYAEVEIDKPHALRFADSVSLTLSVNK